MTSSGRNPILAITEYTPSCLGIKVDVLGSYSLFKSNTSLGYSIWVRSAGPTLCSIVSLIALNADCGTTDPGIGRGNAQGLKKFLFFDDMNNQAPLLYLIH
ncbi:hypothetical protein EMIT019CA3_130073 [Bacillus pseudomycoides]